MEANKPPKDPSTKGQSSCELCQRRKVRCDKGNPCSTCRRAGVKCEVPNRQRLPRGRNGGRRKGDTDLKARIAKLENLVSSLGGSASTDSSNAPLTRWPGQVLDDPTHKESLGDMSRYLGSSFWSNLSSEVNGLREVLADTSESDSETPERSEPTSTPPGTASRGFNFVLCGPDSFMMSPNALESPSKPMIETLYSLYFENVDPLFKILHAPSMAEFMLKGNPYLNHRPGDPAIDALSFAIYYAGISTVDARKCKQQFGEEKAELLNRYRFAFEVCLAKADFINSTEIAVLQAFVIFLASVRVNDRSRWSWTLLALAIRMAQAIGLYAKEGPSSRSPFDSEMRRRLWHQLGILDINAAFDRGSDPMLAGSKNKGVDAPANVNDTDISPNMTGPIISREGFTDMSFCLMGYSGEPLVRKLVFIQGGETAGERQEIEQTWRKRQATVQEFKQSMHEKYLRHCNLDIPFHWFSSRVGEVMGSALMLCTVRPMQVHVQMEVLPMDDFSVLNLAVDIMEKHNEILTTPFTEPWRWFIWVQWHALAVAIAELCSRTEGPDVERAWEIVDVAFQQYADVVADTKRGMLWHPIEKLMKKARQNKKLAQMSKLSLDEKKGASVNEPSMLPSPKIHRDVPMSDFGEERLNIGPSNASANSGWNTGILGPGSIQTSPAPISQQSNPFSTYIPAMTTAPSTASIPLDPSQFSGAEDSNFPLDMAWTNWEDFVGEVNFAGFDMSDPTAGFPQT